MEKILIVEDDPMLIEIYQKKFSTDGYQVITASTGTEVFRKIRLENPHLLLLDLVLPEEDGFSVLEKIKKDKQTKDIRVIVFSNLSQYEDKQKAKRLGAEAFITKADFTPKEMVNKVGEIFSSEPEQIEEVVSELAEEEKLAKVALIENEEVFAKVLAEKIRGEGVEVDIVETDEWQMLSDKYEVVVVDAAALGGAKSVARLEKEMGIPRSNVLALVDKESDVEKLRAVCGKVFVKMQIAPDELAQAAVSLIGN